MSKSKKHCLAVNIGVYDDNSFRNCQLQGFRQDSKDFFKDFLHARDFFGMFQDFSKIFLKHAKKIPSVFQKDTKDLFELLKDT